MATIVVFENISLDGVTQEPSADEGLLGRVEWLARLSPADRAAWAEMILADARGAQALLLGRRSYEFFSGRYNSRTDELANLMNKLPKYVVSSTLDPAPGWNNTTVLAGEVIGAVSALKQEVDGEIRVYASSLLVHALIEHDLVDELRLAVFPLVVGAGERLFGPTSAAKDLHLAHSRTVGGSLAQLTYRPVR